MRHILYVAAFFISIVSYSQTTGAINGTLLDYDSSNAPLIFAKVSIKETGAEALSDKQGFFKFESLKAGEYTLISRFPGYVTKKTKIKVDANQTTVLKLALEVSSLSLDDLVSVVSINEASNTQAAYAEHK